MGRETRWDDLTVDCKHRVWSYVRLDEMLGVVQYAMASRDVAENISSRIAALKSLREAWIGCTGTAVRNLPMYRTVESRKSVLPAEFVCMERLILDKSPILNGELPGAIAELGTTLKVLHCDSNSLSSFPPELARCTRLVTLDASGCCFKSVPDVVLKLKSLRLLSFSQNSDLGPELPANLMDALPRLTHLGFYQCSLEKLPPGLIHTIAYRDDPVALFANVSYNKFPHGYLEDLCRKFPAFRSRVGII